MVFSILRGFVVVQVLQEFSFWGIILRLVS